MEPPELKINEIAIKSQEELTVVFDDMPDLVEQVCMSLANGGSLITCAQKLNVPYSRLAVWLAADPDRSKRVELAKQARDEWLVHRITDELQSIGLVDVRAMFNDDGSLRPLSDIPEAVTKCISGIDVAETSDKDGAVVQVKRIRMIDKMKALEMLGRNLEKFIEKKQVSVVHRVEAFDIEERLRLIDVEVTSERVETVVEKSNESTGVEDI